MQAARDFLEWGSDVKGWSTSTVQSYASHLASLRTSLTARLGRDPEPRDVTAEAIQRHDTIIARAGKAQRSRSSMQACYISFCRYLRHRQLITPEHLASVVGMDRVKVNEKPKRRFATPEQVRLLFEACALVKDEHGPKLAYREPLAYAVLSVLAYTGARAFEACALAVSDVDLTTAAPTVTFRHGKGNRSRTIPLHPVAVEHLRTWIAARPVAGPFLFVVPVYRVGEPVSGKRMTATRMIGMLVELKRLAGISDEAVVKPHAFRRFAATALAAVPGATLKHVQEFLGHSDMTVTLKYIGSSTGELSGLVEKLLLSAPAPVQQQETIRSVRREMTHKRRIPR